MVDYLFKLIYITKLIKYIIKCIKRGVDNLNFLDYGGLERYDDLLKKYIDRKVFEYTGEYGQDKIRFTTDANRVTISAKGTGNIVISSEDCVKHITLNENEYTSESISCNKGDTIVIYDANNITSLDISNNQILEITFLYELPNLHELKLYNNKLDLILFDKLPNLTDVHLQNNPIVDDCLNKESVVEVSERSSNINNDTYEYTNTNKLSTSDSYRKLKYCLSTLPNRSNRKLGSIVLYPWYGLETLIYYSDGKHKVCPSKDWSSPDNAADAAILDKGILCKFPRRIRYDGTYVSNQANKYLASYRAAGTHKYYTDQTLESSIKRYKDYNKDTIVTYPRKNFIEDTGFILNSTIADNCSQYYGLEFPKFIKDSSGKITAESILYAIVIDKDSDIESGSYSSDIDLSNARLKYVTFSIEIDSVNKKVLSISEKVHPLDIYNLIRTDTEIMLSSNNNWYFGSAIQDHEDFSMCYHSFKDSYVQRIWESAEKGFRIQLGIQDAIFGRNTGWDHFNILRLENTGTVVEETMTPAEGSAGQYTHGDSILGMLLSRGLCKYQYSASDTMQNVSYIMGLIPNACVYASRPGTRSGSTGVGILWEMMTSVNAITSSYNVGTGNYNTKMSAVSRYLWGRFGYNNISHCSAGNYATTYARGVVPDSAQLTLDKIERYIGCYSSLADIDAGNYDAKRYPPTTYLTCNTQYKDIPSNSTVVYPNYKYLDAISYLNNQNIQDTHRVLSTFINGYGDNDPTFNTYMMSLSYFGGTSAASPTTCALRCLARNIYLKSHRGYETIDNNSYLWQESEFNINSDKIKIYNEDSVVILYDNPKYPDSKGSLYIGFGMNSEFDKYVKKYFCHIDKYQPRIWQGVGRISFNEDPDDTVDYSGYNLIKPKISRDNSMTIGKVYRIEDEIRPKSFTKISSAVRPVEYPASYSVKLGKKSEVSQNNILCYLVHTVDGFIIPIRSGTINIKYYNMDAYYGLRENNDPDSTVSLLDDRMKGRTSTELIYPSRVNPVSSLKIKVRGIPKLVEGKLPIHFNYNNNTATVIGDTSSVKEFTIQMNVVLTKDRISKFIEADNVQEFIYFWTLSDLDSGQQCFYKAVGSNADVITLATYQVKPVASFNQKAIISGGPITVKSTSYSPARRLMFNDYSKDSQLSRYIFTWTISPKEIVMYINGEKSLANYVLPDTDSPLSSLIVDLSSIRNNDRRISRGLLIYDRILSQSEIIQNTINLLNKE